ncbi:MULTISPECIES: FAD-dependent oxidoreductase [Kitasatospora]|uniref:Putative oxidoreductase n=1 Tax=Kitasatospora setae (strain ATCC 33774 / DSM 43861 / JCM 3304 / KCC A-0304 / NBRC 14216 / KM-6054) TaxID=452652 RepID=E4NB11_KITSK|nr:MULTISPECIES: FAD-dependent oxidoreductase [Kitasatospora]BAJ28392.1 putative oxidoreductase [Kitasatospora setae KM-6054]
MTGKHIVVIGAGYAGLSAAAEIGRGPGRVTLVAPERRFAHRVRQHEIAAGHPVARPEIARVLRGRRVEHLATRAVELDLAAREVRTEDGGRLAYDTLVYALGSRTAWGGVPGAAEHAYSAERAEELRRRLAQAPGTGILAVVGGGATGIELAAELAEAYPARPVRLVASGLVGGWLSERGRAHVLAVLGRLGVRVDEHRRVTAVTASGLTCGEDGDVPAEVVVWAASLEPHPLAAAAGLAVDARGRALVDDHLRSLSHPEVHVVGDAAAVEVPGIGELRMACATAMPQGRYLAKLLTGRTGKPFAFRYATQCLSLGRGEALVQLIHRDDSVRPRVLTGAAGRLVKAGIVKGLPLSLR